MVYRCAKRAFPFIISILQINRSVVYLYNNTLEKVSEVTKEKGPAISEPHVAGVGSNMTEPKFR